MTSRGRVQYYSILPVRLLVWAGAGPRGRFRLAVVIGVGTRGQADLPYAKRIQGLVQFAL